MATKTQTALTNIFAALLSVVFFAFILFFTLFPAALLGRGVEDFLGNGDLGTGTTLVVFVAMWRPTIGMINGWMNFLVTWVARGRTK